MVTSEQFYGQSPRKLTAMCQKPLSNTLLKAQTLRKDKTNKQKNIAQLTFLCSCGSGIDSKLYPPVSLLQRSAKPSHLSPAPTPWKGAVCNTAQQIESASQLKRHTYLIRPVIQGHALLPLHNTLSLFVTTAPPRRRQAFVIWLIAKKDRFHLQSFLSHFYHRFLQGNSTKDYITHIIINAYHVNAVIANHRHHRGSGSGWGWFKESLRIHPVQDQRFSA